MQRQICRAMMESPAIARQRRRDRGKQADAGITRSAPTTRSSPEDRSSSYSSERDPAMLDPRACPDHRARVDGEPGAGKRGAEHRQLSGLSLPACPLPALPAQGASRRLFDSAWARRSAQSRVRGPDRESGRPQLLAVRTRLFRLCRARRCVRRIFRPSDLHGFRCQPARPSFVRAALSGHRTGSLSRRRISHQLLG